MKVTRLVLFAAAIHATARTFTRTADGKTLSAEKDSETFEITGKFKVGDLLAALRAEGLNGSVN